MNETVEMSRRHHVDDQESFISGATTVREMEVPRETVILGSTRYSRRLSDKILIAFHHACDQADFEIAAQLLQILETMLLRRPLTTDSNRRRSMESLVAAYERLWHLRHPSQDPI